jgi:glycosyltransferase involved in cell wall biosynthesis
MCELSNPVELSVIIPAYNEAESIEAVVSQVRALLAQWPRGSEVIVVDDGSCDATGQRAEAAGGHVIHRTTRGGYGSAIKLGLQVARGAFVAILDGDGSYRPEDLNQMLHAIGQWDMVSGERDREWGTWTPLRRAVKGVLRLIAQWGIGQHIADPNSGLKLFRRDVALALQEWLPDGFSCSTSLLMGFLACGFSVRYEPIRYCPRSGRSKFRPVRDAARYLKAVVRLVHDFRPWRLYGPLSAALALGALGLGIFGYQSAATAAYVARLAALLLLVTSALCILRAIYQSRRAAEYIRQVRAKAPQRIFEGRNFTQESNTAIRN